MFDIFFDFFVNRMVIDQVKYHGVDTDITGLKTRMDAAEENIAILTPGGTPVQGSYVFGDWSHSDVIEFAAWTA